MKKLFVLALLGSACAYALRRRRANPDLLAVDTDQPQRQVEAIEKAADVPGGVRP
jgi:hypothetical protein